MAKEKKENPFAKKSEDKKAKSGMKKENPFAKKPKKGDKTCK